MIKFTRVTKRYGKAVALRDISLQVNPGECCALYGQNGAGKSTVLKIIAGIVSIDSGIIEVATKKIAYVGHTIQMMPSLSLLANLHYQLELFAYDKTYFNAIAKRWGIDQYWHKIPQQASRGMLQRAALVRALAIEPDLLLLDEPTTGLDFANQALFHATIDELQQRGVTIVMATHDHIGANKQENRSTMRAIQIGAMH